MNESSLSSPVCLRKATMSNAFLTWHTVAAGLSEFHGEGNSPSAIEFSVTNFFLAAKVFTAQKRQSSPSSSDVDQVFFS
jgi:hypothetical protein